MKATERQKAADVIKALESMADPGKGAFLERFFKTGKGGYAEGDLFLGLTVPESRSVAKGFRELPLEEIKKLMQSKIHEVRLVGLVILVGRFAEGNNEEQKEIFDFYLSNTRHVDNWDLVDLSASQIVGEYLLKMDRRILYSLARSQNLWERRIAMVATFAFIRAGQFGDALAIAEILIADKHDLIHKAVGWMLREVGKRNKRVLYAFLDKHCLNLPRTTLRYAIEHFDPRKRLAYLKRI